jgi:hypothetical protein
LYQFTKCQIFPTIGNSVGNATLINAILDLLEVHVSIEYKKTTTHCIVNPGSDLGQTQTCGGIKPDKGTPLIIGYLTTIHI